MKTNNIVSTSVILIVFITSLILASAVNAIYIYPTGSTYNVTVSSTTPTLNNTYQNLTINYTVNYTDTGLSFNGTDWRKNGQSLAILHLTFDENTNATGGITDKSTYGYNWSKASSVQPWQTDRFGGALFYNTSNGQYPVNQDGFVLNESWSVAAWYNLSQGTRTTTNSMFGDIATHSGWFLYDKNSNSFGFRSSSLGGSTSRCVGATTYVWSAYALNHVVAVANVTNANRFDIYINGAWAAELPTCNETRLNLTTIGRGAAQNNNYGWNGTIDEFMVFNFTLSADQARDLYASYTENEGPVSIGSSFLTYGDNWTACVTPTDGTTVGVTECSNPLYVTGLTVSSTYINFTSDGGLNCTGFANSTVACNDFAPTKSRTPQFKITVADSVPYMNISTDSTNVACSASGNEWTCTDTTERPTGKTTYVINFGYGNGTAYTLAIDSLNITPTIVSTNPLINTTHENITVSLVTNTTVPANLSGTLYRANSTDWRKEGTSLAILHLTFDENTNATGGIKDKSTYGFNGSSVAPAGWQQDKFGGAASFNKTGYVQLVSAVAVNNSWSVAGWYNFSGAAPVGNNNTNFFGDATSTRGYVTYRHNSGNFVFESSSTEGECYFWGGSPWLEPKTMNHVVFVMNGTDNKFSVYINGVYNRTSAACSKTDLNITRIGTGYTGAALANWNGTIDEFMVFNFSLNADQAKQLYDSYGANEGPTTLGSSFLSVGDNVTACASTTNSVYTGETTCSEPITILSDSVPMLLNWTVRPPTGTTWNNSEVFIGSTWYGVYSFNQTIMFNGTVINGNLTANLSAGVYYFNFTATDIYGNTNTSPTYNYTLLPADAILGIVINTTNRHADTNITINVTDAVDIICNWNVSTYSHCGLNIYIYNANNELINTTGLGGSGFFDVTISMKEYYFKSTGMYNISCVATTASGNYTQPNTTISAMVNVTGGPLVTVRGLSIALSSFDVDTDSYNAQQVKAYFGNIPYLPPIRNAQFGYMFMMPNSSYYDLPVTVNVNITNILETTSPGWSSREQVDTASIGLYAGTIYGGVINESIPYTVAWS